MGIDLKVKHGKDLMFVCMVTATQLMSTGISRKIECRSVIGSSCAVPGNRLAWSMAKNELERIPCWNKSPRRIG
jgi:hypothetical protein